MSTEFEEALIAYAQTLDAPGATDNDRRRARKTLLDLIEWEHDNCFGIALRRLVDGCAREGGWL